MRAREEIEKAIIECDKKARDYYLDDNAEMYVRWRERADTLRWVLKDNDIQETSI